MGDLLLAIMLGGGLFAGFWYLTHREKETAPQAPASPDRPSGVFGDGGFAYHTEMDMRDILARNFDAERAMKGIYLQQFIGQYGWESGLSLFAFAPAPDGQNLWTVEDVSRHFGIWCDPSAPWMTTRNEYRNPFHLTYRGEAHGLTIASTRSGKGTGSIIPTLLMTGESFFVLDVKGENWSVTVKNRMMNGYKVRLLNPFQKWRKELGFTPQQSTVQFNPLARLDPDDDRFGEVVHGLAQALIHEKGNKDDDHFVDRARDLVACLLAFVATDKTEIANGTNNIPRIREIMAQSINDFCDFMAGIAEVSDVLIVRNSAKAFAPDKPSEAREVQSIISTAAGRLQFLDNPLINYFLSGNDFDFSELRHNRTGVYFIMSPEQLISYPNLARIVVQSCMNALWRDVKSDDSSVLVVLDEVYQLGKLDIIKKAYGVMAGYKVRLWSIFQDLPQFQKVYGEDWETVIGGAGFIHLLGVNDMTTAEYFSKRIGKSTMQIQSVSSNSGSSYSSGRGQSTGSYGGNRSSGWSFSTQAVDVVPPQKLFELTKNELDKRGLLFVAGEPHPAMTSNVPYFQTDPLADDRAGFSLPFPIGRPPHVLPNAARAADNEKAMAALKEWFAFYEDDRQRQRQLDTQREANAATWDELWALNEKVGINLNETRLNEGDYIRAMLDRLTVDADRERFGELVAIAMPEAHAAMFTRPAN